MNETYKILETRGTDDEIEFVKFAILFQEGNECVIHEKIEKLSATIRADSDEDIILHSVLNVLGAKKLKDLRNDAKKGFSELKAMDVYHNIKWQRNEKIYIRLAMIEFDIWNQFQEYFKQDERSDIELAYFQDANEWDRENKIMKGALKQFDSDLIDQVFKYADVLSKRIHFEDIFE